MRVPDSLLLFDYYLIIIAFIVYLEMWVVIFVMV